MLATEDVKVCCFASIIDGKLARSFELVGRLLAPRFDGGRARPVPSAYRPLQRDGRPSVRELRGEEGAAERGEPGVRGGHGRRLAWFLTQLSLNNE
jgi:hypothetical protein